MVDGIDVRLIKDGDRIVVDADEGIVDLPDVRMVEVVSSIVLIDGKIMLLKRPDTSRSFAGYWSLCSGKIEEGETTEEAAKREILEETQIKVGRSLGDLPPVYVREKNIIWKVFAFIFDAGHAEPVLNHENVDYRLVTLDDMRGMHLMDYTVEFAEKLTKMASEPGVQ